jgi:hypothetical protein
MFLKAAVQVAYMRHYIYYQFAIGYYLYAQYPVCRGMLWSQAQNHFFPLQIFRLVLIRFGKPEVLGLVLVLYGFYRHKS